MDILPLQMLMKLDVWIIYLRLQAFFPTLNIYTSPDSLLLGTCYLILISFNFFSTSVPPSSSMELHYFPSSDIALDPGSI